MIEDISRKAAIAFSVVLILIGIGLSIAAILTPSWQVVDLREYNSIHEHGLWLDCTRHSRYGNVLLRKYATVTEPLHCVYKIDYDKYSGTFSLEDDNSPFGEVNRHKFYGWHTATLILLALALFTAFMSIFIGICGCWYGSLALVFSAITAITLLTTFLSSVAVGLFFFCADNHLIWGIVGTFEQRAGLALALLTGFMSVCIGIRYGSLALVFSAITLLTTFLSSVAVGLFFFYSHRADNRFIKGIVGTYEQRVGLAFFLEMAACFFHFLSFLVAMISTYFSFNKKGAMLDNYSMQRSSRTNITNVARSMEFEPLQQTTKPT